MNGDQTKNSQSSTPSKPSSLHMKLSEFYQ